MNEEIREDAITLVNRHLFDNQLAKGAHFPFLSSLNRSSAQP